MCGVSATIASNESSVQCPVQVLRMNVAAHTAPHHRGEEPPCRQPDTAEMKLEGDRTDTGCRTYSATTKKSCLLIHYVFEIWMKTFTIFIDKTLLQ